MRPPSWRWSSGDVCAACRAALLACALAGCGARSTLDVEPPAAEPTIAITAPHFDCRVSASARPMLAVRVGSAVHFAYPDRSTRQIYAFDIPEGMHLTQAGVTARGDRVAAYAIVSALGGKKEPPAFAEIVLVHVDGTVLVHERHDFAYQGWGSDSRLVGNAGGRFVLTLSEVQAGLGLVVEDEGTHPFSEPMAARSDPDPDGRLVVWNTKASSSSDLHFFDTEAGTFTPARYLSKDPFEDLASSPALLGAGLLYLERNPSRLVYEEASKVSEWPLDITLDSPGHAGPGYDASGGYVLFMLGGQTELDARYLATRFASREAREFTLAPPQGFKLPGDFWNPPPIDAEGRLLVPLAGDQRVELQATRNGIDWTRLGRPFAASSYPVNLRVGGSTVIFRGTGGGMEIPGTLPAWTSQLIGPQGGEGIELIRNDPGAPDNPVYGDDTISPDGACVAYFRSGSLRVVEVADYSASDLGLTADKQSAEMAWIPLLE
ncbi:MAG: hypothetical protein ABI193_03630 [Minicystis sp.]